MKKYFNRFLLNLNSIGICTKKHYVSIVRKLAGKNLNPLEIVKKLDFTVLFALNITCTQKKSVPNESSFDEFKDKIS